MQFKTSLNLKQQQKMLLTPQLLQSINILKMNSMEIKDIVKEQMEQNPALEEYIREYSHSIPNYISRNSDAEDNSYEKYTSMEQTLEEYLKLQIHVELKDKRELHIGNFIIESLDQNGYMSFSTEEIADQIKVSKEDVENVLVKIQELDPPGVAATSLEDCLIRQIHEKDESEEIRKLAEKILKYHVGDVSEKRIGKIAKDTGATTDLVQRTLDFIKSLNPMPGNNFSNNEKIEYIKAEIFVYKNEEGKLVVEDDYHYTPTLTISPYMEKIFKEETDQEVKEFLAGRIEAAKELIKSIEQRRNTILKVAEAIVKRQEEFFYKGSKYLKPLTMKEIADELDIHESTVSRTVNGKYLQCQNGTFELRYFFTSKASEKGDEDVSAGGVKARILEIVKMENPKKPYSDQKILEVLDQEGIVISRRTIAKYRDELGILSSSKRKRY